MHAWPFWLVCPETLQILRDINKIKKTFKKKKKRDVLLTILVAEMASSARFWWLDALSNKKRP